MIPETWPKRQLADYDACDPGTLFGEGHVLSVEQAYELQSAVARLREQRGEKVVGYKVGCTSPKIREQLGIDHSICGRLFDGEQHSSGVELHRSQFANLAIEGELAVELLRAPIDSDFVSRAIPACVASVFPVIELHHQVIRGKRPSAGELIANNAIHAGVVAGTPVDRTKVETELSLSILVGDQVLESCSGHELIDTIRTSLRWLHEVLTERGECLRAGHLVLTGSIPRLIPVQEACRVAVDVDGLGSVTAEFE